MVKEMLMISEVARLLEVDPRTVKRWMDQGILPHVKLPSGTRRIYKAQVEKILEEHAEARE